jgi:hypothetical protein
MVKFYNQGAMPDIREAAAFDYAADLEEAVHRQGVEKDI